MHVVHINILLSTGCMRKLLMEAFITEPILLIIMFDILSLIIHTVKNSRILPSDAERSLRKQIVTIWTAQVTSVVGNLSNST